MLLKTIQNSSLIQWNILKADIRITETFLQQMLFAGSDEILPNSHKFHVGFYKYSKTF